LNRQLPKPAEVLELLQF
jgi:L-lactate dehydrogenase (cytochrome)